MSSFRSFIQTKKLYRPGEITFLYKGPLNASKLLFFGLCATLIICVFFLFRFLSNRISVIVPAKGGVYKEAVIGAPQYINPLLAQTPTDTLLTGLLFSGLVSAPTEQDPATPLLAESFILSPDKKELRITLRKGLHFSDKTPLTARDVAFTYGLFRMYAQEQGRTTPFALTTVETPDETTVLLKTQSDTVDLLTLAATPLLPKAHWEQIGINELKGSTLNLSPVGIGPFTLKRISYERTLPKKITLTRNNAWPLTAPLPKKIIVETYANQLAIKQALLEGTVENTIALSPSFIDAELEKTFAITPIPGTQTMALYARSGTAQNTITLLKNIGTALDKASLVAMIENGYGTPLGATTVTTETLLSGLNAIGYSQDADGTILSQGTAVRLPIALRKDETLIKTATALAKMLEGIGIVPELKVFDQGTFLDEQARGAFGLILEYGDAPLPGYTQVVPLYQNSIVHVSALRSHRYDIQPRPQNNKAYVTTLPARSVYTDTVWKWFTN